MGLRFDLLSRSEVADLAGPEVYARGVGYYRQGRVEPQAGDGGRYRATVRGTVPYTVELWVDDGQAQWSCTCPFAEDGSFCKHAVAVALTLDGGAADTLLDDLLEATDAAHEDEDRLLVFHLDTLPWDRLVELVLQAADNDWRLRERLLAEAHAARGDGPDLAQWRQRVDVAFAPYDDIVTYHEAFDWAREVEEVIDALVELCDAGQPQAAALLVEYAYRRADEAVGYVDDSAGHLSWIAKRLADLHHRACAQHAPDPVALAGRLVPLELSSTLDGFRRAATTYADVLGPDGLAEYRRVVEPRWAELRSDTDGRSPQRFVLREAMVGVALAGEDPDELIEVYRGDLRTADAYLEIARTLAAAGRHEEAETWARDGLEAFSSRPWQTSKLREFLARLLRDAGKPSAAVELYWDAFVRSPSLNAYRDLLEEAGDDAPAQKDRALEALTDHLDTASAGGAEPAWPTPAAVLVDVLAYEGEAERAWQVASQYGCERQMWLTLARTREDAHPLDAVGVYEREVFEVVEDKNNAAYRQAVELLGRIRRLANQAEQPQRFDDILHRLRTEHGRKRNLMQLIDEKGW